jgi:nucleotide sugar dehydrogenase
MEKIGFIGQGWIGKHYADDFESRGYEVVRFSLEPEWLDNQEQIAKCDIVFIAVPTPTTKEGFDDSIVRQVVGLVGTGKTAVIKSTVLPGTTVSIQQDYPEIFVLHSPEFLTEVSAAHDAKNPQRNIIGIPVDNPDYRAKAEAVLAVLPEAPYSVICQAVEAELIKYGRNISGFFRVIFANLLYDLSLKTGGDWAVVREAMSADPDTGPTYLNPIHKSGRGAGGHCFIKDFAAFTKIYSEMIPYDELGQEVLRSLEKKNIDLLQSTNKDLDLLRGVHGDDLKQ